MNSAQLDTEVTNTKDAIDNIVEEIGHVILGKEHAIRLSLACLLARGHLLIEDLPGVGKTTLSHVLASTLGLDYQRIQFTSDLLPADILGISIYDRDSSSFSFHPGPIFSQLILADEVNRATPRAQSALLEAMEESQVTIEGKTRSLPEPFFVIATQNPSNQVGTFPLPESQLDRFTMRIELGYPDNEAERELLKGTDRRELLKHITASIDAEQLVAMQTQADSIHVSEALLDYLQDLLEYSRSSADYTNGLSPRAGLAVLRCARAWALIHGHPQVLPEDIQQVLPSIIAHRLNSVENNGQLTQEANAAHLIKQVPIP
ncbi:MAG: AAA family ATPase [Gammaproteobacteria bacterium]|nr:MAG: AAA family ATPase [Gammaproteobacteria bacterium]